MELLNKHFVSRYFTLTFPKNRQKELLQLWQPHAYRIPTQIKIFLAWEPFCNDIHYSETNMHKFHNQWWLCFLKVGGLYSCHYFFCLLHQPIITPNTFQINKIEWIYMPLETIYEQELKIDLCSVYWNWKTMAPYLYILK